jgi:hypothetical protein
MGDGPAATGVVGAEEPAVPWGEEPPFCASAGDETRSAIPKNKVAGRLSPVPLVNRKESTDPFGLLARPVSAERFNLFAIATTVIS